MTVQRPRDAKRSRQLILDAAEVEFSAKGIHGARVDEIAAKAGLNKRMIYQYFDSKEGLYKAVLVEVYGRLSRLETALLERNAPVVDRLRDLIRLYFEFLHGNPTYVNLILWENLNQARYLREVDIRASKSPVYRRIRDLFEEGRTDGSFRADLDADQMLLSLLTYTFSYFSNRYTLSTLLESDLDDEVRLQARIGSVTDMFLCYLGS
jgi:TetR/AcrR family transcriptional regulator